MNNGWVRLYRSILDWEWWDDPNTMRVFIYCILMASHEDRLWHGNMIERGSLVTSIDGLVKGVKKITEQQVRTSLNKLISTNEITSKSTNKFRVITICNYDKYQNYIEDNQQANQQANQQTNNKQITNKEQTNNNKQEYKNIIIQEYNNISHSTAHTREEEKSEGINEVEKKVAVNSGGDGHGTMWMDAERLYEEYRGELTTEDSEAGKAAVRLMMGCGMSGNIGWVTAKLDEFQDLKRMSGSKGDTRSNYRKHFTSWLRIELEKESRKNNNTNYGNTGNRHQEAERVPQYAERN